MWRFTNTFSLLAGASVVLCALIVFQSFGRDQTVQLLTRHQIDKVVPGCKWWYCSQPQSDAQAAEASSSYHRGYTITETDSLSNAERMAIEPSVTQLVGAHSSHSTQSPIAVAQAPQDSDSARSSDLPALSSTGATELSQPPYDGASESEAAAYAAAHNLGVTLVPAGESEAGQGIVEPESVLGLGMGSNPADVSGGGATDKQLTYYSPALTSPGQVQSLAAVSPRRAASAERAAASAHGRGEGRVERIKAQLAAAEGQLARLQAPAEQARRAELAAAAARKASIQRQLGAAKAELTQMDTRGKSGDKGGARTEELSEMDGQSMMTGLVEHGQSYIDRLEKQLLAARTAAGDAKAAMTAMRAPGAAVEQVGYVTKGKPVVASILAERADDGTEPEGYAPAAVVSPPPSAPVVSVNGAGYAMGGAAGGQTYSTIYGPWASYGPMQRWAAEDSAEHAYTLSKWRESILKAKIRQAQLTKQLMQYEMAAAAPPAGVGGAKSGGGKGKGSELAKVKKEETELKGMVTEVATETMHALRSLSQQVQHLRRGRRGRLANADRHGRVGGGERSSSGVTGLKSYAARELGELETEVAEALKDRRVRRVARERALVRGTPATGVVSLQRRLDAARGEMGRGGGGESLKEAAAARRAVATLSKDLALDKAARQVEAAVGGRRR